MDPQSSILNLDGMQWGYSRRKNVKDLRENSGHRNFCKTQNAFITGFAEMLWKIQVSINPPQEIHHKTPKIKVSSPTKGPMASNDSQTNDVRLPLESVLLPQQFGLLCHQKGSPKCCRGAMPSPVDTWKETAVYRKTSVSKTADGCPKEAAGWGGSKENHVSHSSLLGWEILFAKRKWEDSWFWIYAVSKPDCFHLQIDFLWLGTNFYRKTTWLCGNLVQISPSSTIFNGRKALSQCKRTPRQRSDMLRATETPPTSIRFRKQVSLKMGKVWCHCHSYHIHTSNSFQEKTYHIPVKQVGFLKTKQQKRSKHQSNIAAHALWRYALLVPSLCFSSLASDQPGSIWVNPTNLFIRSYHNTSHSWTMLFGGAASLLGGHQRLRGNGADFARSKMLCGEFRFTSFRDHFLLHIMHMHKNSKHCNPFSSKSLKGQIWCVSTLTLPIWIVGRITRAAPPTEMKKHIIYIENNPMRNSQIVIFCCKQHGLIEKVGHVPQSSYFKNGIATYRSVRRLFQV